MSIKHTEEAIRFLAMDCLTPAPSGRSLAPLSPDLELELVAAVRSGDEAASYRLAELSLWEVVRMARQFTGRGVPFLDLVQEGNLGLIGAVSQIAVEEGSFSELRDARGRRASARTMFSVLSGRG